MIKKWLLLLCLLVAPPVFADQNKVLDLLLLSHLPEDLGCFDASQSLAAGIYVDHVRFVQSNDDVTFANERKLMVSLAGYPDYLKEIDVQKIFAWGYYDADFTLSKLDFISLENPLQIYEIKNHDIRGLCKDGSNQVLFFSERNPTVLNAYSLSDQQTRPAKVGDNLRFAENVGVKINPDGSVNFTGTGLQEYSPGFAIPADFLQNKVPNVGGTWLMLLHREHLIVLVSAGQAAKQVIVWDKDSGNWRSFELDQAYVNIKLFGKYLLFQTEGDEAYAKIAYVFNLATDELGSLRLMPFTKIVYYSEHYVLLAQPYRLLAAAHTVDNQVKILKTFDYPLAWYVKMAAKAQML